MTKNGNSGRAPICETRSVDMERVRMGKTAMESAETYALLAETFKALGDPTRVRILHILEKSEFCVCDLQEIMGMTQSAISHQLRVLRNLRLVKYRKEGRSVIYSLDDNHISSILACGLEHVMERTGQ